MPLSLSRPTITIVSFGAGDNSGAMLLGLYRRNERPDAILFADTGGEKPSTYGFVWNVQGWIETHAPSWPSIMAVRRVDSSGNSLTLEDYSLRSKTLPSIAYGFRSCSEKFKHQPQEKWANHWWLAKREWEQGRKVVKLIGIHAGEAHRAKITEDEKYIYRYPLVEWGWDSERCLQEFEREGSLPPPGKSACFFCPASKKREVLRLRYSNPDLFARAVAMERVALDFSAERLRAAILNWAERQYSGVLQDEDEEPMPQITIAGLGRRWSWESLGEADKAQLKMFPEAPEMPCMCMDGED